MKRTSFTWDLTKYRKMLQTAGFAGRVYLTLSACTLVFFVAIGMIGLGQARFNTSPVSSMKGIASAVSNDFFMDMMGLEVPHMEEKKGITSLSQQSVLGFVFRMLTDINPHDPRTMLAREVPGMNAESSVLISKGGGTDAAVAPQDYPPADVHPTAAPDNGTAAPVPTASPSPTAQPSGSAGASAIGKKMVLIYHSHNRESWVPELGLKDNQASLAQDSKVNITLVGKELADKLKEKGVGVIHSGTDYASTIEKYNWYYSYKYSNKTVKEAMATNPDIQFIFDLHRDDSNREKTTLTYQGKDYAKVYFIIGERNPNWQKNEDFASQLQDRVEQKIPGLSRGIWAKKAADGNAEYNQSLSPHSILIEIGGPFNTLAEAKRTADVLADVVADMVVDAKKVDAPQASPGKVN